MPAKLKPAAMRLYEYRLRRRQIKTSVLATRPANLSTHIDAAHIFRTTFNDCMHREHFCAFHLSLRNRIVGYELIAIGDHLGVQVHPAEVFRGALLSGATALVVSHNHPSGQVEPSPEDDKLTELLWRAGRAIGVPVIDHVIVTEEGHYSYLKNERAPWHNIP